MKQRGLDAGQGSQIPVRQLYPAGHRIAQSPQLFGSFMKSTQPSKHAQSPAGQLAWHIDATQLSVTPGTKKHALPQPPQFLGSVSTLTSHPSEASASQSA